MAIILPIATKFNDAGIKKAQSSFGGLTRSFKNLAGAAGLAIGLTTAVNVLKDSVTAASDLGESLNAVNVAYGANAKNILALGKTAATSVGLSTAEFNSLAVGFSSFSETIAGSGGDVVGVFQKLSARGADFASVFNLSGGVNEAMDLFRSGLAGETEPLRKFGIDMSAAAVTTYALSTGMIKSKKDLTESIKVQARYGLLMQSTSKTQGDFANTSDSLANQQRIMSATIEDVKAKFGNLLLPTMQKVIGFMNDNVIPVITKFIDDVGNPKTETGALFAEIKDAATTAFNIINPAIQTFVDTLSKMFSWLVQNRDIVVAIAIPIALFTAAVILNNAALTVAAAGGLKSWFMATKIGTGIQLAFNAVMAMNPIALVVIAIAALVAGLIWFFTQTEIGKVAWENFTKFIGETVTNIGAFFAGLWQGIVDVFNGIGAFIGSIFEGVGNLVKGYVNFWIGLFESFINFFVDGINGMLGGLNSILDGIKTATSGVISLHVENMPKVTIPRLAEGGIVMPSPGGSIVNVAEAGQPEAIIPLSKMGAMGGGATYNITINAGAGANGGTIGTEIVNAIKAYERSNGKGWRS
jgi:hypothetical protein